MASRSAIAPCPRCDELTIRVDLHGAAATLDRLPNNQGIVVASQDVHGGWHARTQPPGVPIETGVEHRYTLHDCGAEKAAEPPAPVAQLATWRKAEAAASRQRRNARARGTGTPVTRAWGRPR